MDASVGLGMPVGTARGEPSVVLHVAQFCLAPSALRTGNTLPRVSPLLPLHYVATPHRLPLASPDDLCQLELFPAALVPVDVVILGGAAS